MADRCSSTPGRKQLTHERIVQVAARAVREQGYQGLGVADIMKRAGLTHGGFYAHFDSREDLIAEAVQAAGEETGAHWQRMAEHARAQGGDLLQTLLRSYLSMEHVQAEGSGCLLAALASETARQPDAVRTVLTERTRGMAQMLQQAGALGADVPEATTPCPEARADIPDAPALAMASLLVGTLALARACNDSALREALLEAGRRGAAQLAGHSEPTADDAGGAP